MLRLARAWKILRLTAKLRISFRAMLAAYRQQNWRQQGPPREAPPDQTNDT
jgi:hypothetical protein